MRRFGTIVGALGVLGMTWILGAGCAAPVETPEEQGASALPGGGEANVAVAAEAVTGCHTNTTCPNPKSCGSWSGFYACGTDCHVNRGCGGCGPVLQDPGCVPDGTLGLYEYDEQFRTCILQDGTRCTEYQEAAGPHLISCGCTR
jgi:hypothetical protein